MFSIKTNFAAMTALQSLTATNKDILTTQNRIATGYRVASASDNAAYWSMATTMRNDDRALSTVSDALGLGAATVDTASTAMKSAIDVMGEIKNKLVAAKQPGVDSTKVQAEIDQLQDQLRSISSAASFSGENWLSVDSGATGYNATKDVVASMSRTSSGSVSLGTISIDTSSIQLFNSNTDGKGGAVGSGSATTVQLGLLGSQRYTAAEATSKSGTAGAIAANAGDGSIVIASADGKNEMDITKSGGPSIDDYLTAVDSALSDMTKAATTLGAASTRITGQKDFIGSLRNALQRGISTLVDADMNEESTKLQALQVQQQLGIQALSMANSGAQSILQLFRGG